MQQPLKKFVNTETMHYMNNTLYYDSLKIY